MLKAAYQLRAIFKKLTGIPACWHLSQRTCFSRDCFV